MSLFDANTVDTDPGTEMLLALLHGPVDGAARARARGEERIKVGWAPCDKARNIGRRTGRLAKTRAVSAAVS